MTLLVVVAASAEAQPTRTSTKDAGVAALLSVVVPGGGHIYAEETIPGLLLLGGAVAAVGYGVTNREKAVPRVCSFSVVIGRDFCTSPRSADNSSLKLGGYIYGALWIFGLVDAAPAARRANAKRASVSFFPNDPRGAGVEVRVSF